MSSALLLAAVLSAAACVVLLVALERRRRRREVLLAYLRGFTGAEESAQLRRRAHRGWQRHVLDLLSRAGIVPARWQLWSGAAVLLASALLGGLLHRGAGLLLYPAIAGGLGYLFLLHRATLRRRLMIEQLPVFIDHLVRAVGTGNTLDTAVAVATAEAHEPLRSVFERVVRETRLGGVLEESLEQAALTYGLAELRILTLAVRVNRRYGSSIQDLLKSVVQVIRRAEAARREFKALTGETRLSAWVLGLMPILLAGYIMLASPNYLGTMWSDPAGRIVLLAALGLQLVGGAVLWRMMRIL